MKLAKKKKTEKDGRVKKNKNWKRVFSLKQGEECFKKEQKKAKAFEYCPFLM